MVKYAMLYNIRIQGFGITMVTHNYHNNDVLQLKIKISRDECLFQ